jgi:hypothetical protein
MKGYYWIIINREFATAGTKDYAEAMEIAKDTATRHRFTQVEYNGKIIWQNY